MYTQYEKQIAIRNIVAHYTEIKYDEIKKTQYLLAHKSKKGNFNKPAISAIELQRIQQEFAFGLTFTIGMDDIIRRFKNAREARIAEELEKYISINPCSHIIGAMAYHYAKENIFPKEIELSTDQEVINEQITKIFAYKDALKEWKVVCSILLEILPYIRGIQEVIHSRQIKR